jgi:hypothetical protein
LFSECFSGFVFLALSDCFIKNRNMGDGVVVEFCLCGIEGPACV